MTTPKEIVRREDMTKLDKQRFNVGEILETFAAIGPTQEKQADYIRDYIDTLETREEAAFYAGQELVVSNFRGHETQVFKYDTYTDYKESLK